MRSAYLGVTNAFAMLRLLPTSDRDKDVEILALRHQITMLERQLGKQRVHFNANDRALLAALLRRLPRTVTGRMRLLVRPDTLLRWHRSLVARRHATVSRPKRPPTALPDRGETARGGCRAMRVSGVLRADTDTHTPATGVIAALQGGYLLAQTARDTKPMEIALDMALAHVRTFESDSDPPPSRLERQFSARRKEPECGRMRLAGLPACGARRWYSVKSDGHHGRPSAVRISILDS